MATTYCPSCDKEVVAIVEMGKEVFPVKGEDIEIESSYLLCPSCGEKIFNEDLDGKSLDLAFSTYRRRHKLLFPQEIKSIRKQYALSQRALAGLLSWGEITIHRYESGAIQDRAHNEILELIKEPENMLKIYQENSEALAPHLQEKLFGRISALIDETLEPRFISTFENYLSHKKSGVSEFTGYKEFDLNKAEQMILYVVETLRETFKTKINKLLWYSDFAFFKKHTVSISGNTYAHLPYGPIPDDYDWIISMMVEEKLLHKEEREFGEAITPLVHCNKKLFNQAELDALDFVIETFKSLTCTQISGKSHEELPYKNTSSGERISYQMAKDLTISLP